VNDIPEFKSRCAGNVDYDWHYVQCEEGGSAPEAGEMTFGQHEPWSDFRYFVRFYDDEAEYPLHLRICKHCACVYVESL
jgi:hypothetical protein